MAVKQVSGGGLTITTTVTPNGDLDKKLDKPTIQTSDVVILGDGSTKPISEITPNVAPTWGGITGALASQTDLKTILDTKLEKPYTQTPDVVILGDGSTKPISEIAGGGSVDISNFVPYTGGDKPLFINAAVQVEYNYKTTRIDNNHISFCDEDELAGIYGLGAKILMPAGLMKMGSPLTFSHDAGSYQLANLQDKSTDSEYSLMLISDANGNLGVKHITSDDGGMQYGTNFGNEYEKTQIYGANISQNFYNPENGESVCRLQMYCGGKNWGDNQGYNGVVSSENLRFDFTNLYLRKSGSQNSELEPVGVDAQILAIDNEGKLGKFNLPQAPAPTWGGITGTLASQTDVMAEFAKKVNISTVNKLYFTPEILPLSIDNNLSAKVAVTHPVLNKTVYVLPVAKPAFDNCFDSLFDVLKSFGYKKYSNYPEIQGQSINSKSFAPIAFKTTGLNNQYAYNPAEKYNIAIIKQHITNPADLQFVLDFNGSLLAKPVNFEVYWIGNCDLKTKCNLDINNQPNAEVVFEVMTNKTQVNKYWFSINNDYRYKLAMYTTDPALNVQMEYGFDIEIEYQPFFKFNELY